MIVQGAVGLLGGSAILVGGPLLADLRLILFGLALLLPSSFVVYFWFRKL